MKTILTNNPADYIRVVEFHEQQGRDDVVNQVLPLQPIDDFLVEAKDQVNDLDVANVAFENCSHFGEDESMEHLVVHEVGAVLESY